MADFILNMPLRFFARVFGNPAGDPVLLKSRGVTLLRDTGSSPGCASLGLKQAADDGEDEYGKEAADFKCNDFYVDDRLQSVPNVEKAVKGFVAMQD